MITLEEYNTYGPINVDSALRKENEFLFNQFFNKYTVLPPSLKSLISDTATAEFIKKLVTDFGLSEESGTELARIVRDILLGEVYYKDLRTAVEKRAKVDVSKAAQVADQINTHLFVPVLNDIRRVQTQLEKEYESLAAVLPKTEPQLQIIPQPATPPTEESSMTPEAPATTTRYFDKTPVPDENVVDLRNI